MTIKPEDLTKREYHVQGNWYGSGTSKNQKKRKPKGESDFKQCERNQKTKSGKELLREVMNAW